MSQENHQPLLASPERDAAGFGGIADQLNLVKGFLRRRYLSIAVCLVVSLGLAAVYYVVAPRTYTASATMLIETQKGPLRELLSNAAPQDATWIESQIGVLRSQNVAAYVVRQLRLADDPQFNGTNSGPIDKILRRIGLGSQEQRSEAERVGAAISQVMGNLEIRRIGASYMIQINFRAPTPDHAVKVANAMIDAYIFDQLNAKYEANRRAGDWLQERLQSLREQAAAAERAVIEFRAKNNIVKAGGTLMNEKYLSEMSGRMATTRAHTIDLQARLERIAAVREAYQQEQSASAADETVSEAMSNAVIGRLRNQYLDMVNRESDWAVRYGKNHTAVVNLRNQIRDIRKSIRDELGRIEETFKSEYQIAKKQQDEAEKALGTLVSQSSETNQAQIALFSLEAAAQSYRKLYDSFLQRHTETVQQQTLPITDARMLSPAGVIRSGPQLLQTSFMLIVAGAMLGVGFGVLREMMDRGFRTKDQVRTLLNRECLALVPVLATSGLRPIRDQQPDVVQLRNKTLQPVLVADRGDPRRRLRPNSKVWQNIVQTPTSLGAEAIRELKLNLDLGVTPNNVIGLTSALPGEGKTTIAAAVAACIAQNGERVILVDGDLRNPSLSRSLAPDARVGLIEVVQGNTILPEALWYDPLTKLDFLPAVIDPFVPSRNDVFASSAALSFFSALQTRYDYVVVDLAPLVAGVDVRATLRHITSCLLVIEWGATKIEDVEYALRNAPGVRESIVGAVLNKVDMEAMGLYDSYGAQYYYGRPRLAQLN